MLKAPTREPKRTPQVDSASSKVWYGQTEARGAAKWRVSGVAAGLALVLTACGAHKPQRAPIATTTRHTVTSTAELPRFAPTPARILRACHALAASRSVPVRCPRRLPNAAWRITDRSIVEGRCSYLMNLSGTPPDGPVAPFHLLLGGTCLRLPLDAPQGRWPPPAFTGQDFGLYPGPKLCDAASQRGACQRPRLLARVRVRDRRALLLQVPPFPVGGAHGGHIVAIWNQGTSGYIVSVHFAGTDRPHGSAFEGTVTAIAEAASRAGQ